MSDTSIKLDLSHAEPGATPEALKACEVISGILFGFPRQAVMSVLMNLTAMAICHFAKDKTGALDESRYFRKGVERCIEKNWHVISRERGPS